MALFFLIRPFLARKGWNQYKKYVFLLPKSHLIKRMRLLYLLFFSVLAVPALGQDPQFSQFYANPVYHNPAFTGGNGQSRAVVNYRNQWPALGANYQTAAASFDTYLAPERFPIGVGVGVQAIHDSQSNHIRSNTAAAQSALDVTLSQDRDGYLRLIWGQQVAYTSALYNPNGLSFVDQFSSGGLTNPVSADPLSQVGLTRNFINFSTGIILEANRDDNRPSFWVGGSLHNIQKSLTRGDLVGQRFGLQAGITFPLETGWAKHGLGNEQDRLQNISFTAAYRQQGADRQLDAGINFLYEPIMFGVWYRGIPLRKYNQTSQRDAVLMLAGFQMTDSPIRVQYSYDVTVSSLSWATGGAHELTLWYSFDAVFGGLSGRRGSANRARKCIRF
jgi:type IX secretion system PorP/SprF family membrane protein